MASQLQRCCQGSLLSDQKQPGLLHHIPEVNVRGNACCISVAAMMQRRGGSRVKARADFPALLLFIPNKLTVFTVATLKDVTVCLLFKIPLGCSIRRQQNRAAERGTWIKCHAVR